jgi:DNA-binding winged helix-turn-helix (wHTH) protein
VSVRFGPFTLDIAARRVTRDGRDIHLSPKAFQLLASLVSERPNALSKATLQEQLWPGTFVVEANLSNLVAEIRRALGDRGRAPRWIWTVHGFGYRFGGDAAPVVSASPSPKDRPACWLLWGRRRFRLSLGEHIIGRDPDVDVRLDASTVSRRHGRLTVTADGTFLEDLGSKNGILRGQERVSSAVQLSDGDAIHIGSVLLTFHVPSLVVSTDTHMRGVS